MFHDMGLFSGVLGPLFVGFPSILLSPATFLQDPARWLQAVTEHRATITGGPNFAFDYCVRAVPEEQRRQFDVTGRLKDLIIIRGRNIYPQDVELAVERVIPFARANSVAAFALEGAATEHLGIVVEADRAFVRACSEPVAGDDATRSKPDRSVTALIDGIRNAVAEEFEVRVQWVAFVRSGSFPRTSSGKVQRRACRSGLQQETLDVVHAWRSPIVNGATNRNAARAERRDAAVPSAKVPDMHQVDEPLPLPVVMPAAELTADDEPLVRLVQNRVLQWIRSEVDSGLQHLDPDASLLAYGIDSVGAATIARQLAQETGARISPTVIYDNPTIRQLSEFIRRQKPHSRLHERSSARVSSPSVSSFEQFWRDSNQRIRDLQSAGRYFYETPFTGHNGIQLQVGDKSMLMLASFGYLGLIDHVSEAPGTGIRLQHGQSGTGAGSGPEVFGHSGTEAVTRGMLAAQRPPARRRFERGRVSSGPHRVGHCPFVVRHGRGSSRPDGPLSQPGSVRRSDHLSGGADKRSSAATERDGDAYRCGYRFCD